MEHRADGDDEPSGRDEVLGDRGPTTRSTRPRADGDLPVWLRVLDRYRAAMDVVSEVGGWIAARLIFVIFVIGIGNVVLRYYGRTSGQTLVSNFWIDSQWQLYALAFLLGFPYGVKHQLNPRVDFWWSDFPKKRKALIDLIFHAFLLLPFTILGVRLTWPFAATAMGRSFNGEWSTWRLWEIWETSPNPDGLPIGPIKFMMMVGFILFGLQVVAEIIRSLLVYLGHDEVQVVDPDAPLRVE